MPENQKKPIRLKLLPLYRYIGVDRKDPIRFYRLPVIGSLYQRRIELCLEQMEGGDSVLEIGFGSGVSFLNLKEIYQHIHGLDLTAEVAPIAEMFSGMGIGTDLRNGSVLDMPYADNQFDAVLLISILEHLQPADQTKAFSEILRVLKPGGQLVYGVPVERPLMVFLFRLLGTDIRTHHFSTEEDVRQAAERAFGEGQITPLRGPLGLFGQVYQVGNFKK
ncbi:MAG: class I SAM-dependent methyltransferase [Anaerolineaceae bacterium]